MVRKAFIVIGMLFIAQCAAAELTPQGTKLVGGGRWGVSPGYDYYLYSVVVSADGSTIVIAGKSDDPAAGSARVFTRSDGVWSQQPEIPVGSGAVETFGRMYSAAISADGNTAVIGAPENDSETGAAWVFTRSNGVWSQQGGKLVGSDAVGTAFQGKSVAISGDGNTIVMGGPGDSSWIGATWVFTRSNGVWSQQGPKLVGAGIAGGAGQGYAVAISGDGNTAAVGDLWDGDGAAWVFTRSNGVWSQQGGKLVGSDAVGSAYQGNSVAISGDGNTIVVGGPGDDSNVGAAWVFTRSNGVWSQQGPKLVGAGVAGGAGQGYAVAISGDGANVIVGGPWDNSDTGAAWVFTRSGGTWSQKGAKVVGDGTLANVYQGASVAISANGATFVVGAPMDGNTGAAWVFSSSAVAGWVPAAAHTDGLNGSQWRSDLGLLNPSSATANVELQFFGSDGVVSNTVQVPAGAQSILTDVVGQLGAGGQGALEVLTDQPLKLTARTYTQTAPDAGCFPGGTHGQEYPVLAAGEGLSAGQSAYLPGLIENAGYRSNIGLVNTDDRAATVLVELYDGAGTKLAEYTVGLAHGQWAQETQPFKRKAGQTAMDRGYAKVTVQSGSGVSAFASVIDNVTNDPTNVTMQR